VSNSSLSERVERQLDGVIDPCSRFNGTWLSFNDLGMIESVIETEPGRVLIRLMLDDPLCLYMVDIHTEVRAAALEAIGVEQVDIEVVADQLWTPERMTPETIAKMDRWRELRARKQAAAAAGSPLLQIEPMPVSQSACATPAGAETPTHGGS
jgi:metal-sulfur cluster biosynthetic enzyme